MTKEFCCGFSLRTGNLILLWSVLILESFHSLLYLTALLVIRHLDSISEEQFFPDILAYYLVWSITGILLSILGLEAIHEKKPKLLNGIFWYFCYGVIFNLFRIIVMTILARVFGQSKNRNKLEALIHLRLSTNDLASIFVLIYTLILATLTYFALVVRSYRDKMMMKMQKETSPAIDTSLSMEPIRQSEQTDNQEKQQISNG